MKKTGILNAPLSYQIARLGHTDFLTICDAGLPIPSSIDCVDLALSEGVPSFLSVFQAVTTECFVERVILAKEIEQHNAQLHQILLQRIAQLAQQQHNDIVVDYVCHEEFKALSQESKAIVRSGECSPYANIILVSGVPF
ncbi:D-ribose pyranase [Avibacterium sp. 20-126]|uniref:D-ribose pyranase n=1 Tax=Avibacterium sp. 20-126 TaxID=2911524 RepID=UPI00218AADB6|nr:D-ribose pyranase [Avibacterium sp. 20-126]